jgi:plastocyanin
MKRFLPAMALLALVAAGCGSNNSKSSGVNTNSSSQPSQTTASGNSATNAGTVTINMKGIAFDPKETSAHVGQTVKWVNQDTVDHNVTATDGEDFKSKDFGKGGTYSYKLDKAGTIKYTCTIHPGMDGVLSVTE